MGSTSDLASKNDRPRAVQRVMIPKPGGGERPQTVKPAFDLKKLLSSLAHRARFNTPDFA